MTQVGSDLDLDLATNVVNFELNGRKIKAKSSQTLIEIAKHEGIEIPHLCYKSGMASVGNCRACVVEIEGERVLAPSCCRYPSENMKVQTDSAHRALTTVTTQKVGSRPLPA